MYTNENCFEIPLVVDIFGTEFPKYLTLVRYNSTTQNKGLACILNWKTKKVKFEIKDSIPQPAIYI